MTIRYFSSCKSCRKRIDDNDDMIINIYYKGELLFTCHSIDCLKKYFYIKKKVVIKSFLFFRFRKVKTVWINKKYPNRRYKVIFHGYWGDNPF